MKWLLLGLIVLWVLTRTFLWDFAALFRNLLRPEKNAPLWRKKRRSFASAIADEENDMSHGGC